MKTEKKLEDAANELTDYLELVFNEYETICKKCNVDLDPIFKTSKFLFQEDDKHHKSKTGRHIPRIIIRELLIKLVHVAEMEYVDSAFEEGAESMKENKANELRKQNSNNARSPRRSKNKREREALALDIIKDYAEINGHEKTVSTSNKSFARDLEKKILEKGYKNVGNKSLLDSIAEAKKKLK